MAISKIRLKEMREAVLSDEKIAELRETGDALEAYSKRVKNPNLTATVIALLDMGEKRIRMSRMIAELLEELEARDE